MHFLFEEMGETTLFSRKFWKYYINYHETIQMRNA